MAIIQGGKWLQNQPRCGQETPCGQSSDTISVMSGVEFMETELPHHDKESLMTRYLAKAEQEESFIKISFNEDSYKDDPIGDPCYSPTESDIEEEEEEDDIDMDLDISLCIPQSHQVPLHQLPVIDNALVDDSDDEDFDEEAADEEAEEEDVVRMRKSLCFESCLKELANVRIPKVCQRKRCEETIQLKLKYVGSACQMIWTCSKGHHVYTWNSQSRMRKVFVGNFLLSSAILTSGNNFNKIALMAKFLNMGMVSCTTHMKFQRVFTAPVIGDMYSEMMDQTLEKYKGKDIVIAGDGRNDSPGHSAMYCTYSFMEYDSKDIVASVVIDKRMTSLKSTAMEKEGMIRALDILQNKGVKVVEICTDAHPQIAAMMKQNHPDIKHSYDTWHGAKNFGKKLTGVAAETTNKELRPWVQDIVNHFWFCSRKAQGSDLAFISRWRGVLHHVTNVHEWVFGDGGGPAQCEHGDISDSPHDAESKWIEPGCSAHEALAKTVLDTRFLNTLKYFVNFRHTGELENFHELLLMYAAKRFAYSYPMYKARNQLAVIDYMMHKERPQAVDKKGEKMYARKYSKRNNNWSAVPVKEKKGYLYMPDLMKKMVTALKNHQGPLPTKFQLEEDDPRLIRKTIAQVSPIATKELVAMKVSRFKD